jgi:hypothetical protein
MGISDLFKRFKTNAAAFEQSQEKRGYQEGGIDESQAARAEHEGHNAPETERANDHDDS